MTSVLLVEDDADNRAAVADLLTILNYKVTVTYTAEEALFASSQAEFDIALVDIHLPGLSGGALIERLRQDSPDIVLIGMSGSDLSQQCKEIGADAFVNKPFTTQDLIAAITTARIDWH